MFQTVDLCLHLDRPPLPIPLTVPSCLLGDAAPASPPARPWLSQSLQRVLEDQADTMLQEMLMDNSYLLGIYLGGRSWSQVSEVIVMLLYPIKFLPFWLVLKLMFARVPVCVDSQML